MSALVCISHYSVRNAGFCNPWHAPGEGGDDLGFIAAALEIVAQADSHERRADGAQVFQKSERNGALLFEDTVVLDFEQAFPLVSRSSSQTTHDADGKVVQKITRQRNYTGR